MPISGVGKTNPEADGFWVGVEVVVEAELDAWKGVVKTVKPEVWKEAGMVGP